MRIAIPDKDSKMLDEMIASTVAREIENDILRDGTTDYSDVAFQPDQIRDFAFYSAVKFRNVYRKNNGPN